MQRPTDDQFGIAIEWLRANEGEGDELAACQAVSDWLEHESNEHWLRREARAAGVPVARLRRKLNDLKFAAA